MKKKAVISKEGLYRYTLIREWDPWLPRVMFIMLNPSTADANNDDPTIRRCIGFAKSWEFGSIAVGNLFAYRATNPKELLTVADPIGPDNQHFLEHLESGSDIVVAAWGNGPIVRKLIGNNNPVPWINDVYCIDRAKDGTPKHPLYLKGHLIPQFINLNNNQK